MRRKLLILLLFPLPALAELELLSSQLVSQLPDGLGEVVEADLDGDGDRDLLVTGRRNDFLGWIEATASGPAGFVRPIHTGSIPVAGQRPIFADLDGLGLPDLHFPGWTLPNLFRRFGPPEPHPATAGLEFLAARGDQVAARSTVSGEWKFVSPAGVVPLLASGSILHSLAAPADGLVHFGDVDGDGTLDLLAVLDGVTRGGSPVARGLYYFPGTPAGFGEPNRISSVVPRLLCPVYQNATSPRVTATLGGRDITIQDDFPPFDPPRTETQIRMFWRDSRTSVEWDDRLVVNVAPDASALAARPQDDFEDLEFEVAASDTTYEARSLHRYRTENIRDPLQYSNFIGITTRRGVHLLNEPGACGIIPIVNSGSRLLTFPSSAANPGAETIRRVDPGDLVDTVPGDGLDSAPLLGRLVAGPFGLFEHASWQDLAQDGWPELVAATERCEALLLFDSASPQAPRALSSTVDPISYPPFPRDHGPPISGDLDGDGDRDLARTSELTPGYPVQLFWENLGENQFGLTVDPQRFVSFASAEGYEPFRVDRDITTNRARVLLSMPGAVTAEWFARRDDDPFPLPVVYPGLGARVVSSDRDIDGDGDLDLVFFPSVFGNAVAWGAWNPATGYLDSLERVSTHPAGVTVPSLKSGDLDGDGTPDLFHPSLDGSGQQVTWVAGRLAAGTLTSFAHPAVSLPVAATRVLPLDLDNDGDIDLVRLIPDTTAPVQADGIRPHELRWSEYIGGLWVHHATVLGTLRTSAVIPEPVLRKEAVAGGDRTLLVNRIGEILEIKTRVLSSGGPLAAMLAADGITGASSGSEDDPDGDGIPNFAEVLAGTSPVVANPGFSIPLQALAAGPNSGWIASLPVSLAEFGINARLETTGDLAAWTRYDAAPLALGMQAGRHRYLFPDDALDAAPGRRFARIVFTQE